VKIGGRTQVMYGQDAPAAQPLIEAPGAPQPKVRDPQPAPRIEPAQAIPMPPQAQHLPMAMLPTIVLPAPEQLIEPSAPEVSPEELSPITVSRREAR